MIDPNRNVFNKYIYGDNTYNEESDDIESDDEDLMTTSEKINRRNCHKDKVLWKNYNKKKRDM